MDTLIQDMKDYAQENSVPIMSEEGIVFLQKFIDAAKAQNIRFFERFSPLLNKYGYIITDNMYFHGLVEKKDLSNETKNVRKMVEKIRNYHQYLNNLEDYHSTIYKIGDGISVSEKLS